MTSSVPGSNYKTFWEDSPCRRVQGSEMNNYYF